MIGDTLYLRSFCVLLASALAAAATIDARPSLAAVAGSESIGEELLDGLDPEMFGPPPTPSDAQPARPDFQKRIAPHQIDERWGEDLGQPSANEPLARIERGMLLAADSMGEAESRPHARDAQTEVVSELDKLIEQLSKQCCGGACKPGEEPKPPSKRSQSSPKKVGAKPGRGKSPARESNSQLRQGDPGAVNMAEREEMMKDLWGHLPAQVREQMLESYSDEFLPEYEIEIEKYFRRMAEEKADN